MDSVTTLMTSHNTEGGEECLEAYTTVRLLTMNSATTLMTSHNTEGGEECLEACELAVRDVDAMCPLVVFEGSGGFADILCGARFSAGFCTRGCHWIPRMFA
jgi:hypothetical protein